MTNPLCKYCGKSMMVKDVDYYGTSYECKCCGYLKEKELEQEVVKIENDLFEKKAELRTHKANSLYERLIREHENKITEIKNQYIEF